MERKVFVAIPSRKRKVCESYYSVNGGRNLYQIRYWNKPFDFIGINLLVFI